MVIMELLLQCCIISTLVRISGELVMVGVKCRRHIPDQTSNHNVCIITDWDKMTVIKALQRENLPNNIE